MIMKSGKFDVLICGQRWIVNRGRSYAFSHRGAHFCLRGDGGRVRDLTFQPAVKHQSPAAKPTNSNSCDHAVAQEKQHISEIRSERTASSEPISKKGVKLIPKTIGNRKGDRA